ncbi:uncharacterized protein MYCFIDRAFT_173755 [Pseudocercospora fijiensis CIRAD86]|uniref:Uncharacterized protein n=1 Tax=Pseudocercospora fijiensis (strain CIRAD86) TaxID=383855 RepID=M3B656_PSEFD|nr:uncharacterized protein MYCFIDRAFT_173755 [Pseudocercospora fijiensis CIRAD86]EME84852.1 hypothetical protein MYCFIDRAFT_173755 [Pseudocercospora fijiensis CIRAD86]
MCLCEAALQDREKISSSILAVFTFDNLARGQDRNAAFSIVEVSRSAREARISALCGKCGSSAGLEMAHDFFGKYIRSSWSCLRLCSYDPTVWRPVVEAAMVAELREEGMMEILIVWILYNTETPTRNALTSAIVPSVPSRRDDFKLSTIFASLASITFAFASILGANAVQTAIFDEEEHYEMILKSSRKMRISKSSGMVSTSKEVILDEVLSQTLILADLKDRKAQSLSLMGLVSAVIAVTSSVSMLSEERLAIFEVFAARGLSSDIDNSAASRSGVHWAYKTAYGNATSQGGFEQLLRRRLGERQEGRCVFFWPYEMISEPTLAEAGTTRTFHYRTFN